MENHEKKLLVPIDIDVLVVDGHGNSRDYASLTPKFDILSEGVVLGDMVAGDQVFETSGNLERGVHLHWNLPDSLKHGVQEKNTENIKFLAVPNRWLVIRTLNNSGRSDLFRAWIVESDRLFYEEWPDNASSVSIPIRESEDDPIWFRYLGCKYDYKIWKEESSKLDKDSYLPKLTAFGPGDPFFASYYPNCRSVFGFHDDLRDLPEGEKSNLAYIVVGWYSSTEQSPLNGYVGEKLKARLKELKWEIEEDLNDETSFPVQLYHGMVYDICWEGEIGNYSSHTSNGDFSIAVGNTSVEALSALLQLKMADGKQEQNGISRILDALQYNHLSKLDTTPDGIVEMETSNYQEAFSPMSGGSQWVIINHSNRQGIKGDEIDHNPNNPLPASISNQLTELNDLQKRYEILRRELDSIQWELYSTWYKYVQERDSIFYSRPEINDALNIIERLEGKAEKTNIEIGDLVKKIEAVKEGIKGDCEKNKGENTGEDLKLDEIAGPQFWIPNEPIVLLSNTKCSSEQVCESISEERSLLCKISARKDENISNLESIRETIDRFSAECEANNSIAKEIKDLCSEMPNLICLDSPGCKKYDPYPETPLFMLWEVELFRPSLTIMEDMILKNWHLDDIDFTWNHEIGDVSNWQSHQYQGVTILTPHAKLNLQRSLMRYVDNHNAIKDIIGDIDILSQSLGGFNNALIMRKQTLQFPVFDRPGRYGGNPKLAKKVSSLVGDMNHLSPLIDYNFSPIREGFLKMSRIWIVDCFGQIQETDTNKDLVIAESLRTPGKDSLITLPPRIIQPSRLLFRWVSASQRNLMDSNKKLIESNSDPGTTPVFGWIMPNHLDRSLMIYDSDGAILGSLQLICDESGKEEVQLLAPPGVSSDPCFEPQIDDENLRSFIHEVLSKGADALLDLLDHIDETLQGIETLGSRHDQNLSVLVGRPLALARATLKLELFGPPVYDQSWESLGKFDTKGLEKVNFPVRLGDVNRLKDGLIGYFIHNSKDGYNTFHSAHGFSAEGRSSSKSSYINYDHEIKLTCDPEAKPVLLTLLIDPRGGVHITSGILPTKFIEIPHYHISESLSAMEVSFMVTPLISNSALADAVDMPLPAVSRGKWSFACKQGDDWKELDATSKGQNVILMPGNQQIFEGWLKLSKGLDEKETN